MFEFVDGPGFDCATQFDHMASSGVQAAIQPAGASYFVTNFDAMLASQISNKLPLFGTHGVDLTGALGGPVGSPTTNGVVSYGTNFAGVSRLDASQID